MNKDTELRKLPADSLSTVEDVLETNEDWKRFMSLIPKNLEYMDSEPYELKYNGEDIRLIENHAHESRVNCAKLFFVEWGTSGRVRPTLRTLQALLVKAEIFKAADAIAKMLNEPPPERPAFGPAAQVDINVTGMLNSDSMTQQLNSTSSNNNCNDPTRKLDPSSLIQFSETQGLDPSLELKSTEDMIQFPSSTSFTNISKETTSEAVITTSKAVTTTSKPYLPDSALLNPRTIVSESMSVSSSSDYESSHYHATQSSKSQSTSSPYSNFQKKIDIDILENEKLIQFTYKELEAITNNFEVLIGRGGYGEVFKGNHEALGPLAVKKEYNVQYNEETLLAATKMFNSEVKSLSLLCHMNIVPILGYCIDGPALCIVCEYIEGGSLRQNLDNQVLNKSQRLEIMIGTAEGLKYIHNTVKSIPSLANKTYSFHGDVKSANILLTKDCIPKLCDFGLAKQLEATYRSKNIKGTSPYMAPEGFIGSITHKSDIYSYGIVLLELLTGLKAIVDKNSEFLNIKDYVKENIVNNDITLLLDDVVSNWSKAQSIYGIAKLCLNRDSDKRPSMDVICEELYKISNSKVPECDN